MVNLLANVIVPLYLLIGIGFLIGKVKSDVETESISFLVLSVFAPALILSSFRKINISSFELSCIVISAIFVVLSVWLSIFLYERVRLKQRLPSLEISSTIMNSGYLGIPLVYLLFGEKGLPYGVSFMVVMTVIHFTYGIFILQKNLKEGLIETLKLPVIYAIVAAFLLKEVKLPRGFERMIELTGDATMPLMLVSIGISLSRIKVATLKFGFISSAFRLIGGFVFSLFIVSFLSCNEMVSKVVVVQSSLPPAILNFVLCSRFKVNPEIASSSIFIGTLISPIWIAVVVKLLFYFYNAGG